jgi:outer membrane receptor protein involved in Fe transport
VLAAPGSFYDFVESVTYHAWTPRVSAQLRIARDTFLYGSAARGFKSGGLNVTASTPGSAYLPEFAWTYEIGIKRTMAHERVRLNAAMFYNDYSNLQVQTFVEAGVTRISNAAVSTIKGAEIETAAAAWRGLQLAGHLAWLDAKYDRYDAVGPGDVRGDASGHRLNNAPAWSGSASTLYTPRWKKAGTCLSAVTCSGRVAPSSRHSTLTSSRRRPTGCYICAPVSGLPAGDGSSRCTCATSVTTDT